jgi:hypothetical protein
MGEWRKRFSYSKPRYQIVVADQFHARPQFSRRKSSRQALNRSMGVPEAESGYGHAWLQTENLCPCQELGIIKKAVKECRLLGCGAV